MKQEDESPNALKSDDVKEGDVRLSRREAVIKGAVALGATAVAIYVPPKLRPFPVSKAFAKASPANKESCEKNPNEDCGKCIADYKDPGEKGEDGGPKDPNKEDYEKCVTDKPCDKDPNADKPGDKSTEGSVPQTDPKCFAGPIKNEWG